MTVPQERSHPRYRPPKHLPYELREHCVIYFEEELYTQSLTLLTNLLTSGTSFTTPSGDPVPAFVPTPQQLALASTLVVHPRLTTRATSKERLQASNVAYRLLRNVNKIVGPINADFATAFTFTQNVRGRGEGRRRASGDESGEDPGMINSEIANEGSLWARAEDFWHAVGWVFNCSVAYPKRWERWKLWLEFMLDVLEDDWVERSRIVGEEGGRSNNKPEEDLLAQSMIVRYLSGCKGSFGSKRRIIRAIFADGSAKSLGEFREIFKNEPRERKKKSGDTETRRPVKVDIDQEVFGDYLDNDSDDDDVEETSESTPAKPVEGHPHHAGEKILVVGEQPQRVTTVSDGAERFGGMDSLVLRQRMLSLLSAVSARSNKYFTPLDDLYDMYIEHIRPLPLPSFSLLTLPVLPGVPPAYRSSFNQLLLATLIASSAPVINEDNLSQEILETCYLPFPANTHSVLDNAKVSLLVESLLRLQAVHAGLVFTSELGNAVEIGVQAREVKAKGGVRKKRDNLLREEEESWVYLQASSQRMKELVEALK
ncbi:hypothetical protein GP486_005749 [Trichoglossum hirsutum]|uniref:Uncharacterized protein n=1 Tax=Trichoglossum hirsutum TaxID=265104 RepID=A0A9P8L8M5_9PEZI|nr:hypothetical protein GP486_005749 [Trichoglossum hirsutum]